MGGLQGVLLPLLLMVDDAASRVSFEVVGHQSLLQGLYKTEEDCDEHDQHLNTGVPGRQRTSTLETQKLGCIPTSNQ